MKKQHRDKKPKNKTGKQQKKELLKRLKDIQENKKSADKTHDNESTSTDNTIMSSIQFLNTLSKESISKPNTDTTDNVPTTHVPTTHVPTTHVPTTHVPTMPVPTMPVPTTHVPTTHVPIEDLAVENTTTVKKEPPYSNLKGSKKPSYREWLKQKSQTISIEKDPVNQVIRDNLREEKFKKLQKKYKKQNKRQKTIKITETFGKRNGKVSIHIKNKHEKDKLENEKKTLKKHSIPKIKAYLKEHNLLKIGSYAPNDVLREMYESAILSGDINNNNKDILVHNFMEN